MPIKTRATYGTPPATPRGRLRSNANTVALIAKTAPHHYSLTPKLGGPNKSISGAPDDFPVVVVSHLSVLTYAPAASLYSYSIMSNRIFNILELITTR